MNAVIYARYSSDNRKSNRVHVMSVTEPISNTPEGIMLESLPS